MNIVFVSIGFLFLLVLVLRVSIARKIILIAFCVIMFIIIQKAVALYNSGSEIYPELVSDARLNKYGDELMRIFVEYDGDMSHACALFKNNDLMNVIDLNKGYLNADSLYDARLTRLEWIKKNDFTSTEHSMYRGRYMHHYNTILSPARSLYEGDFVPAFLSQYGLISIIPVMLLKGKDFVLYPAISLFMLPFFAVLSTYALIKSGCKINETLYAIVVVVMLIAFSIDLGALRIAPGFSLYRYFPIFMMTTILLYIKDKIKLWLMIIIMLLAVINSIQYNIVFLVAMIAYYVFNIGAGRKVVNSFYYLFFVVLIVFFVQAFVYYNYAGVFDGGVFVSVAAGKTDYTYSLVLMLFPLVASVAEYGCLKSDSDDSNGIEYDVPGLSVFVLIYSLYSMSFAKSPGHYAGYLITVLTPVSMILAKLFGCKCRKHYFYPVVVVLCLTSLGYLGIRYHYLKMLGKYEVVKPIIYDSEKYGNLLKFSIPNDLSSLDAQLKGVMLRHKIQRNNLYFISKDKVYIELFESKNYLPINYDPYANIVNVGIDDMIDEMKRRRVGYILLDSDKNIDSMELYLEYGYQKYINKKEYEGYKEILSKIRALSKDTRVSFIEDTGRWTLYGIQK